MKRAASRPAPYEVPAKLSKRTTSTTVSRRLSSLKRTVTDVRPPMPPPKFPSVRRKTPSIPRSASLPKPNWPTLVPTGRRSTESEPSPTGGMAEISEEPTTRVPGLRKLSTLPLEEEKKLSREGSKALSKTGSKSMSKTDSKLQLIKTPSSLRKSGSSLSGVPLLATLEKEGSVTSLDASGDVTTVTRLPSGSSVGETTSLSLAPPAFRAELSKATNSVFGKADLVKKVVKKLSSIRVYGTDAPEEEKEEEEAPTSLSRRSSSKPGPSRKESSLGPSTSAPPVPLPPGGLIEIVFSFDTTGSMSTCIDEVRGRVGDMIQRLQADIPGIRIAVIAHGDYCDARFFYVIKWIDFGASVPELCDFVQNISGTGGGDFDECYELVMARAQTELSWTPGSQRSLVMIGDATPHPPSFYHDREEQLDWKEEVQNLADKGIRIYAVQAMNNPSSTSFYKTMADRTGGHHLKLDQFNNIFDMLMVLCYNEKGVEFVQAYEDEVRTREGPAGLNKDLEGLFTTIRGGKVSESAKKVLSKGATKAKPTTPASAKKSPTPAAAAKGKAKTTAAKAKPKVVGAKTGVKAGTKTGGKGGTKTGGKTGKAAAKPRGKGAKAGGKAGAKAGGKAGAKAGGKAGAKAATTKTGAKAAKKASAKAAAKMARGKGVKSVKGRKPTTTSKTACKHKKKTQASKAKRTKKLPGVKRAFREAVKDDELSQGSCLKHVEWEDWIRAIVPRKIRGPQSPHFKDRFLHQTKHDRAGLRNVQLYRDNRNAPALYEVAVQMKPKKRYVMFVKAVNKWNHRVKWDTILLNTPTLRATVNAVLLHCGGQIWLRRGNVQNEVQLKEAKRHVTKMYDYAWLPRKTARGGTALHARRVKKCNTLISGRVYPQ